MHDIVDDCRIILENIMRRGTVSVFEINFVKRSDARKKLYWDIPKIYREREYHKICRQEFFLTLKSLKRLKFLSKKHFQIIEMILDWDNPQNVIQSTHQKHMKTKT